MTALINESDIFVLNFLCISPSVICILFHNDLDVLLLKLQLLCSMLLDIYFNACALSSYIYLTSYTIVECCKILLNARVFFTLAVIVNIEPSILNKYYILMIY